MRNSRRLYLAIINLSFSSWLEVGDGFMPGCGNLPSHKELAVRFPNAVITAKWPGGHSSRSRERTLEIWDPRFLCTPEHSIQIKTPKLMLAQSGSKFRRRKLLNKFLICYVWKISHIGYWISKIFLLEASQSTHLLFPAISYFILFIFWISTELALCPPLALLLSFPWNWN